MLSFICTSATSTRVWSPFKDLITLPFGTIKFFFFFHIEKSNNDWRRHLNERIILAANYYCTTKTFLYIYSLLEHFGSLKHNYLAVIYHKYVTYYNVLESSVVCKSA